MFALLAFSLMVQQAPNNGPNCTGGVAGAADICQADREAAQAETVQGAERRRHLQAALDLYRKAASAANDPSTKIKALDAATRTLDARHLNEPSALELTLRELVGLAPNDLQFMSDCRKFRKSRENSRLPRTLSWRLIVSSRRNSSLTRCSRSSMRGEPQRFPGRLPMRTGHPQPQPTSLAPLTTTASIA